MTAYYISPTGNNANSGLSSGLPKLTFSHTLPFLGAGDILWMLDGQYTGANSGYISVTSSHANGTVSSPITIKAVNERQAWLRAASTEANNITIANRNYWVFEGIRCSNARNSGLSRGSCVIADNANNITFRRMLMHDPNDATGQGWFVAQITDCNNHLWEENESYNFAVHNYFFSNPSGGGGHVVRRCYANPRGFGNVSSGNPCCFAFRGTSSCIAENCIAEGGFGGFDVGATYTCIGNQLLGCIAVGHWISFQLKTQYDSLVGQVRDVTMRHCVGVPSQVTGAQGVIARGLLNAQIINCTWFGNPSSSGIYADYETGAAGGGTRTIFLTNCVSLNNGNWGYVQNPEGRGYHTATNDYPNGFNNSTDTSGWTTTNGANLNPGYGACRCWAPDASPLKGAGSGGVDKGATILYRYHNGVLTSEPLWDTTTGAFPVGATVAGLNVITTDSAANFHQRVSVNTNGCLFPAGYSSSQPLPGTPPVWAGGGGFEW